MEKWVTTPNDPYGLVLSYPWPITWAYSLLVVVVLLGAFVARWRTLTPKPFLVLPLAWLIWQYGATFRSLDLELSLGTVLHFSAAVLCFYLGVFALGTCKSFSGIFLGLLFGFLAVLAEGCQQHFGGLAATKRYFELYVYPQMQDVPPEYFKKLNSTRIFSTLFYPNALAGVLLLLWPGILTSLWHLKSQFTLPARLFIMVFVSLGTLACLFWSGSKGGWLLMLLLGLVTLLRLRFPRRYKLLLISALLVVGLAGFFWKYAGFFQKGATSVGARFDYWEAAVRITAAHPFLGTGPGTFGASYASIKRPESEPSRLAHNDYLQQAADSGLIGFLVYTVFIVGGLVWSYPSQPRPPHTQGSPPPPAPAGRSEVSGAPEGLRYALWLGVLGWALQGLVEFGLYIPALSWPAFAFLGWLLAQPRVR